VLQVINNFNNISSLRSDFYFSMDELRRLGEGGGRADKEIGISIYSSNPCLLLCIVR